MNDRRKKILVVEDQPQEVKVWTDPLMEFFDVVIQIDVDAAVEYLEETAHTDRMPDLVTIDLNVKGPMSRVSAIYHTLAPPKFSGQAFGLFIAEQYPLLPYLYVTISGLHRLHPDDNRRLSKVVYKRLIRDNPQLVLNEINALINHH